MHYIGIVVAMEKELNPLLSLFGNYIEKTINNQKIFLLQKFPNIVIILSGVGEIHSAMATTTLIDNFNIKRIINYGYVGSYNNNLKVGDLINITDVIHCDVDLSIEGKPKGQYNDYNFTSFKADSFYFKSITNNEMTLLSSDKFLDDGEEKNNVIKIFGDNIADMEGAGIAVVCYKAKIPFSMIKCVSNTPNQSYLEYYEYSLKGIKNCVEEIYKYLIKNNLEV